MTSTMAEKPERGEVFGLSDEVIARMRQRFADEGKRMLEKMAKHATCTCGRETEHAETCPVGAWLEAAHAIWLWGNP